MSADRSLPALLQQENADLRGRVDALEAELRYTEGDLTVAVDEATAARSNRDRWQAVWKLATDSAIRLTDERDHARSEWHRHNVRADALRAERDALAETLRAARDYVDHQWGRAEQAAEQVRRIDSAGVALAFADLAAILGSDEQDGDE